MNIIHALSGPFTTALEGFDAVLRDGVCPPGTPDLTARVAALQIALAAQLPAAQVAGIMQHIRAAEAAMAFDAELAMHYATLVNTLQPPANYWRTMMSTAWYLACAAASGRWTP